MKRLLLAALIVLPAAAQEEPVAPPVPPPAATIMHEVRLGGGSLLVGQVEPRLWKVATRFGTLSVPVEDIKRVRFGRKAHPERFDHVLALISDLASANPDRRNHAVASLKKEGAFAAPELSRAAKRHADPEVRRLCQEILDALNIDENDFIPDDDEVETTIFRVSGSVTLNSFKVTVAELGSLNIQRRDIVSVRLYKSARGRTLKVNGQHIMAGNWLDTKIKIRKGLRLRIQAEGTIHWPRWGNQVVTPEGNPNMGNINGIWVGALVGRVGNGGSLFRIGSKYSGAPQGKGTLQLCVMMNQRGQPSTGEFTVTIEEE